MRKYLIPALVAVGLLSGCEQPGTFNGAASDDPARLVYAPAGTKIKLLNAVNGKPSESSITAGAATGVRGAFLDANGVPGGFYPGCWGCGGTTTIEEEVYARLWPLDAGKQVTFIRTADNGEKARVVIRVAGIETIETPAGTFKTWTLDGRIENLSGPRYSAQVRAWWAPQPGWVVKAEGGDSRGNTLSSQVAEIVLP